MNVSSTGQTNPAIVQNSTQSAYPPSNTTQSISNKNNADSVIISSAALAVHHKTLEEGALPSWWSENGAPTNILNLHTDGSMGETKELIRISDAAHDDGIITKAEQKAMDSYRDNMGETKAWRAQQFFNIEHSQELAEYGKLRIDALSQAKTSFGIDPKLKMTLILNTT